MNEATEQDADMEKGAEGRVVHEGEGSRRDFVGTSALGLAAASPQQHSSRREFLGISTMGLAAAMIPQKALRSVVDAPRAEVSGDRGMAGAGAATRGAQGMKGSSAAGEISVSVTAGEDRFAAGPKIAWQPAAQVSAAEQVQLDASRKFQEILGFGGAFTDAACYMFNQLPAAAREKLLHEMFHPSEMGFSVCRTCIGSSDYSAKVYSFDEGDADPDLTRFSIDHDREYILPVLKQARQANPDLFLFSSPWSPPGWMKFNKSMLGGSMRRFYFPAYAKYFQKFLQGYADAGVPVQAVTPQNEVDTDQDGKMPACIWAQEYEMEFVAEHLGPLLESSGMGTKIWILDHNYNLWGRVMDELESGRVRKYASGIAWHGYVGTADMMSKVHDAFPDVPMYWTEGGPDYTDPNYATDWCKWGGTFTEVLRNWCRSITAWNLALDERGKPNIGPFSCGGTVTINSQTKEITRSGQFWAFAHYSRVVRRGAWRFDSQGGSADLAHVAFENPDGQRVIVVSNPGDARTVAVRLEDHAASVALKANSLTTLAWK